MTLHERPALSVEDAVRRRRSVRAFLPNEIPEATLREIFELAQLAPSNCNAQPWTPHVVSGPALRNLRAALVAAAAGERPLAPDYEANWKFAGVYRERQIDAALQLYGAMGIERRDMAGRQTRLSAQFRRFRRAAHGVRVHGRRFRRP